MFTGVLTGGAPLRTARGHPLCAAAYALFELAVDGGRADGKCGTTAALPPACGRPPPHGSHVTTVAPPPLRPPPDLRYVTTAAPGQGGRDAQGTPSARPHTLCLSLLLTEGRADGKCGTTAALPPACKRLPPHGSYVTIAAPPRHVGDCRPTTAT